MLSNISNIQLIKTHAEMKFEEKLCSGESYERWLVDVLNSLGISCYTPNVQEKLKACGHSFFARLQRDVLIRLPNSTKRVILEVKSRTKNPFKFDTVDVGLVKTWDAKQFPVTHLAVIRQSDLKVMFTKADEETRKNKWLKRKNNDYCYSIPKNLFGTFEQWFNKYSSIYCVK